jgi:hypothetical protein
MMPFLQLPLQANNKVIVHPCDLHPAALCLLSQIIQSGQPVARLGCDEMLADL